METPTHPREVLCPSAQHDSPGAKIFAVVGGSAAQAEVSYLSAPQPVTPELLALAHPVAPAEVFRFAAACAGSGCKHFAAEHSQCQLAQKTVQWVPKVVATLPACTIRAHCRWFQQEGREACLRCPQVVTNNAMPNEVMRSAGDPQRRVEDASHQPTI
jgi:hypothetical protein